MAGRPEGDDTGVYNSEPYDKDAWQEFTPWRPGDPPADEHPAATARDSAYVQRGRSRETPSTPSQSPSKPAADPDTGRSGRWWTEDVPRPYEGREKVRSTGVIGGILMQHVPAGTNGVVDKVEKSVLGEDRVTVRFDNGYTETVSPSDLERRGFWD